MESFKRKLKEAWDDNPLAVIGVTALAVTAAAKLLEAMNSSRRARTWEREVMRRDLKDRLR